MPPLDQIPTQAHFDTLIRRLEELTAAFTLVAFHSCEDSALRETAIDVQTIRTLLADQRR